MTRLERAIATAYLITALAGGVAMVFVTPPFQAPDEPNHFFRAQALSEGYVLARRESDKVGAPVRTSIAGWALEIFDDIAGRPDKKQSLDWLRGHRDPRHDDPSVAFVDFRNTALYSPVPYLPQAIGLGLGRWLRWPLLDAYYLGRLLNLLASVLLCYWTATRLPYGQLTFVMLALCPMFLFEQASFSADGLTYGLAAAFCGAVLQRSAAGDTALRRRDVIELSCLGVLMALTKPSSAPLPLLALLLLRRAPGVRSRWREVSIIAGASWAAMLGWSVLVSGMYIVANPSPGIDPAAQRAWLEAHPAEFAVIVWRTLRANVFPLYYSAVGVLGWLDTPLAIRYVDYFYALLLVSGVVAEPRSPRPSWQGRGLAVTMGLSTFLLIGLISYLTWTPVGSPLIQGFQGRYFLPLSVPFALLLQWPRRVQRVLGPLSRWMVAAACVVYAMFFLAHAFQTISRRYWF